MPTWDAGSKYRLLLSIITVLDAKPPKWEEVVELMGPGYTTESVRQQYQKIKKQTKAELAPSEDGSAGITTPRKRGKANGANQNTNGKRKGTAADEEEDDEEIEMSPSKKSKVKRESSVDHALVAKVEQDDEYVVAVGQKLTGVKTD